MLPCLVRTTDSRKSCKQIMLKNVYILQGGGGESGDGKQKIVVKIKNCSFDLHQGELKQQNWAAEVAEVREMKF